MSRRTVKTPGWAAFDPKKQHKQVLDDEPKNDPYPPISSSTSTLQPRSGNLNGKSFSTVLTRSPFMENNSQSETTTSTLIENNVSRFYERLKLLHPWANENLIEDIVAAVGNDIEKASTLLHEMAPRPGSLQEKKEIEVEDNVQEVRLDNSMLENRSLDVESSGKELVHNNLPPGFMIDMSMVPVEPEWEDDDMYLLHRKEAIRAMRLASRHSKAASEAYLRRDHIAAQELSLKAQQEWSNAEKLHANAAKEILALRNSENDDWKLDLHGLHAAEAVQVLLEHLLKIESKVSGTHSLKPDKSKEHTSQETDKSDRQQILSRSRLLEVITGKGSHSRGEAALPVAIRSFLSEKGYYYYEARTGVITVQPKFRQLSTALSNT